MAKQTKNSDSGSDGSWFLEAVGAVPAPPTPSETVTSLEKDNTLTELQPVVAATAHEIVLSSFDGTTGTSTAAFDAPMHVTDHNDIGILIDDTAPEGSEPPPPQSDSPSPDDGGEETGLSPVLRTRRPFRWPVAAFGLLVVVAVAVAAFWLPAALKREAIGVTQSYADASLALRLELPNGQAALDTITDPFSPTEELSGAVPAISQLDSAAHALVVVATEPLPPQLPVVPVAEVAALGPLQDAAQINAAQGSDIARRLGHVFVYRTTIPQLLNTGELPTSADVQTINALSVSLASSLVDDSNALSDLPTTEATSDLNNAAHAAVERFAFWQEEYLGALTEGDEALATSLLAELEDIWTGLNEMLVTALGVARVEIDQQIVELATSLETYLEGITR